MKPQSGIYPCPTSYPSSASVGLPLPYKSTTTNPYLFPVTNLLPKKPSESFLFSFLTTLAHKGFPAISLRHRFSTSFPRAVKSIITATVGCSAPGLSSSAPTQHFLSLALTPRPCFTQTAWKQWAAFGLCSQFLGGAADELIGAALAPMGYGVPVRLERTAETL